MYIQNDAHIGDLVPGRKGKVAFGSFAHRLETGDYGAELFAKLAHASCSVLGINSVEDSPVFRRRGVDYLVTAQDGDELYLLEVELKTDNTHYDNFFLETVSNKNTNSVGCFLGTQSDVFAYQFPNSGDLFLIPTRAAQRWYLANAARFTAGCTATPSNNGRKVLYPTRGSKVPVTTLLAEVSGVQYIDLRTLEMNLPLTRASRGRRALGLHPPQVDLGSALVRASLANPD